MDDLSQQPELLAAFRAESEDYLNKLEHGLLVLEKNSSDVDLIHEMFRVAHTLKGAAAMMGFTQIKEVSHKMEDLFGLVRSGRLVLQAGMMDRVLAGVDVIRTLLQQIGAAESDAGLDGDVATVCRQLEEAARMDQASGAEPPGDGRTPATAPSAVIPQVDVEKKQAAAAPSSIVDETMRIPMVRLNKLLNLVGELVINKVKSSHKTMLLRSLIQQGAKLQAHLEALSRVSSSDKAWTEQESARTLVHEYSKTTSMLRGQLLVLFDTITKELDHIDPIVDELQRRMKELRMLPCEYLFGQLSRVARDVAHSLNKEIHFEVDGGETELDKKVLEEIKGPLIHLLRNCIDHGIETPEERERAGKPRQGRVGLFAEQYGEHVVITITDDGRGIDPQRIKEAALRKGVVSLHDVGTMGPSDLQNLVFAKGFSTSDIVTDISGRGVGLDAVRTQVEALKGQVILTSQAGGGTTFRLELPLTIALIRALLVRVADELFAIPLTAVEESVKVSEQEFARVDTKLALPIRDHLVPVVRFADVLKLATGHSGNGNRGKKSSDRDTFASIVIVSSFGKRVGFRVDEILGDQEIYVKSLGAHVGKVRNLSGATVLGTGELVLIVDVADLMRSAQESSPAHTVAPTAVGVAKSQRRILVVEDSLTTRELEQQLLESRGFLVETAADGLEALGILNQKTFDLVISDVEMPRMDGFELCRALRSHETTKDIPVVFLTTMEKDSDKRRGIEVGAQAYIVKSAFHEGTLLQTINQLVGV